ncbi:MAG: transposase [Lysobacterales bacterium]
MSIKYRIRLTEKEQHELKSLIKENRVAKHKREHAQILLGVDENGAKLQAKEIAQVCGVSEKTVERVRKRCVEEGLEIAVNSRFSNHGRPRSLGGEEEAHLVAITCSEPPEGQQRWTLKLLSERMVTLNHVEAVSESTVGRVLKKMN